MILLDTNACIAAMRGNARMAARLVQHGGRVRVPFVSVAELHYGIERLIRLGQPTQAARGRLDEFLKTVGGIAMVTDDTLTCYARLRADLEAGGTLIGPNDLWIAALAVAEDALLVSANTREFSRVPGLRLENWLAR